MTKRDDAKRLLLGFLGRVGALRDSPAEPPVESPVLDWEKARAAALTALDIARSGYPGAAWQIFTPLHGAVYKQRINESLRLLAEAHVFAGQKGIVDLRAAVGDLGKALGVADEQTAQNTDSRAEIESIVDAIIEAAKEEMWAEPAGAADLRIDVERRLLAARAMEAMIANGTDTNYPLAIARGAIACADALLSELAKPRNQE